MSKVNTVEDELSKWDVFEKDLMVRNTLIISNWMVEIMMMMWINMVVEK